MDWFENGPVPDVAILDLNMPEMDGYETARAVQKKFPTVNVLMLTMYDSELSLIRLLQSGVKGFLKKDIHPSELKFAIHSVMNAGYYYSNHTAGKLANLFRSTDDKKNFLAKHDAFGTGIAILKTRLFGPYLQRNCSKNGFKSEIG